MRNYQALKEFNELLNRTTPEELEALIRVGCELTGEDPVDARLRIKFRKGVLIGLMPCLLNDFEQRMRGRINYEQFRSLRKLRALSAAIEAVCARLREHEQTCVQGHNCLVNCMVDAVIFSAVAKDWQIAAYAEADERDYNAMRRDVLRFKNFRAVTED